MARAVSTLLRLIDAMTAVDWTCLVLVVVVAIVIAANEPRV